MHPIRNGVNRVAGIERVRDLTMPHRDAVDEPRPALIITSCSTPLMLAGLDEFTAPFPQDLMRQLGRKLIMTGRHRRMGGEYAMLPHLLDHLRRHRSIARLPAEFRFDQRQHQQCRMPFAEMVPIDVVMPQGLQQCEAAETENQFLTEPVVGISPYNESVMVRSQGLFSGRSVSSRYTGTACSGHAGDDMPPGAHLHRSPFDLNWRHAAPTAPQNH